jgi:asparagine synthetase B (glutamine-hydrolysing)
MARVAGSRVKTFSVGFESEGSSIDEGQDAQRTARFLGTDHNAVIVQGSEVRDRLSHIASGLDQPSVDGINSYFVSMAARRGVTVAISGTGGDEMFAGYPWFAKTVLAVQHEQEQVWQTRTRMLLAISRHPLLDNLASGQPVTGLPERLRNRVQARLRSASVAPGLSPVAQIIDLRLGQICSPGYEHLQAGRAIHYDKRD